MDTEKKLFCAVCGAPVQEGQKFCHECGSPLTDANVLEAPKSDVPELGTVPPIGTAQPIGVYPPADNEPEENVPKGPDDSGLKMIVDYCRKTLATAMGDGHDETVLYLDEKTGQYQIHVYSLPVGARSEHHVGFAAEPAVYDEVTKYIEKVDLAGYDGKQGEAICGGEVVVKFLKGDKMIRISTDNMPYKHQNELDMVGHILGTHIDKEKELH